jgi:hypothetical protein
MDQEYNRMIPIFLNAWKLAVISHHSKQMEYLNNPTPEVVRELSARRVRLRKLHQWASDRWGGKRIGAEILSREDE